MRHLDPLLISFKTVVKNRGLHAMECWERNVKKTENKTKPRENLHFFFLGGAGFAAEGFAAAGSFWLAAGCSGAETSEIYLS